MNLVLLIEKITRERIYLSEYYKSECFGINSATLVDKAVALDAIGGVYSNDRPTAFICLLLKLLSLNPSRAIIMEYINQKDFKYATALGLMYLRLTGSSNDIYSIIDVFYADYRRLRLRDSSGYSLAFMDTFCDDLLTKERVFNIILPRLQPREAPRVSVLQKELDTLHKIIKPATTVSKRKKRKLTFKNK